MKFGDMICYRNPGIIPGGMHDGPIMYLAECRHSHRDGGGSGLIDMLGIPEGEINHKDPSMWQRCTHLDKGDITITVDGEDVTDEVELKVIGENAIQITSPYSDFEIEYRGKL